MLQILLATDHYKRRVIYNGGISVQWTTSVLKPIPLQRVTESVALWRPWSTYCLVCAEHLVNYLSGSKHGTPWTDTRQICWNICCPYIYIPQIGQSFPIHTFYSPIWSTSGFAFNVSGSPTGRDQRTFFTQHKCFLHAEPFIVATHSFLLRGNFRDK